jgi:hypothetical protein
MMDAGRKPAQIAPETRPRNLKSDDDEIMTAASWRSSTAC